MEDNGGSGMKRLLGLILIALSFFLLIPNTNAISQTRIFRSDTALVNGLNVNILGTTAGITTTAYTAVTSDTQSNIGVIFCKRTSAGVLSQIVGGSCSTSGIPTQTVSFTSTGYTLKQYVATVPQVTMARTDSIEAFVQCYDTTVPSAANIQIFQTEQLNTLQIDAGSWTVQIFGAFISSKCAFRVDGTSQSDVLNFNFGDYSTTIIETETWKDVLTKSGTKIFTEIETFADVLIKSGTKILTETEKWRDDLVKTGETLLTEIETWQDTLTKSGTKILIEVETWKDVITKSGTKFLTEIETWKDVLMKSGTKVLIEIEKWKDVLNRALSSKQYVYVLISNGFMIGSAGAFIILILIASLIIFRVKRK